MKVVDLRLSPQTVELLEVLSKKLGVSPSAVIEMAVVRMAGQEELGYTGESGGYAGGGEALLDEVREEISREAGEGERKGN